MSSTHSSRLRIPVEAPSADAQVETVVFPWLRRPISRIGFGTAGLLRTGSTRHRQDLLAAALGNGITHFDTAPIYGFGEAERTLGRFLSRRRSQVTVTTKFGLKPSPLAGRLVVFQRAARSALRLFPALRQAAIRSSGALYAAPSFSPSAIRASLETSLRALRTDHVDFFLAHQASIEALPAEEVIGLLEDLQRAGKILAFGVATEFDWLPPVLERRPELDRVVQFDSELTRSNMAAFGSRSDQLLVTFSFIGRTLSLLRERLREDPGVANPVTSIARGVSSLDGWALDRLDDDTLGAMLLRGAALANPRGVVLTQSRSIKRIELNARAATSNRDDERVRAVVNLLGTGR
jgi:hypothetical protein